MRFVPRRDGDRAGLAVFQNDDYWAFVGMGMEGGKPVLQLVARRGPGEPAAGVVIASVPFPVKPGDPVQLTIDAKGADYRFRFMTEAGAFELGKIDGRMLSTKTAGGFIGVTFGPYAYAAP